MGRGTWGRRDHFLRPKWARLGSPHLHKEEHREIRNLAWLSVGKRRQKPSLALPAESPTGRDMLAWSSVLLPAPQKVEPSRLWRQFLRLAWWTTNPSATGKLALK